MRFYATDDAANGCGGLDLSRSAAQERPLGPGRARPSLGDHLFALCIVLLVGLVVLFRHALGLDVLDYGNSIGVAALLGLAGVIALGVALMAATFYSSRSGIDEAAQDASGRGDEEPPRFG